MEAFPQVNLINRAGNTTESYYIVNQFRVLFGLVPKLRNKEEKPALEK